MSNIAMCVLNYLPCCRHVLIRLYLLLQIQFHHDQPLKMANGLSLMLAYPAVRGEDTDC